jgi:hypothetical protein
MSKSEGISRIAKVIRGAGWLVIFGTGLVMLITKNLGPDGVTIGIFVAAIFAVPCFAVAWIIDGFAK